MNPATKHYASLVGLFMLLLAGVGLTGCTTTQGGALWGGGLGAATGAIIGHQSGHSGPGALIGAGVGALSGALIGDAIDHSRPAPRYRDYGYDRDYYDDYYYERPVRVREYHHHHHYRRYRPCPPPPVIIRERRSYYCY